MLLLIMILCIICALIIYSINKMASKTILLLLGLTIIAVAYGAYVEEEEDAEILVEDLLEYFSPMEKRGPKIGGKFPSVATRHLLNNFGYYMLEGYLLFPKVPRKCWSYHVS